MKEQSTEILLASYNGAPYIKQQIDSIMAQIESDWRLVLSDDGSTDGTEEILDAYVRQYPERMTRVYSGKRFGNARDHFFWLMKQSNAEVMFFCDQDDVWHPDKMQKMKAAMEQAQKQYGEKTPLLVFSDQIVTDGQLQVISPSLMDYQRQYSMHFDYRSILMQNVVTGGAMAINRALATLAGQCTAPQQTVMHDWWLAAVAARFGKIVYIDEALGEYRQHGNNSVGAKNVRSMGYVMEKLKKLPQLRKLILKKKAQADVFRKTFVEELTPEDRRFLLNYAKSHSGLAFYWTYRAQVHGWMRWLGGWILG